MNSNLGVNETLALLDGLKNSVRDFAAREETLSGEFRVKSSALVKSLDVASKEQMSKLAKEQAEAEADFLAKKAQCQSRFERRKVKINEAHKVVRKRVLEKVSDQEGRKKHRLQQHAIEVERGRESGLGNAAATLQELQHKLAESRDAFGLLEATARQAFGGYGKFRRLLSPNRQWPEPDLSGDETQLLQDLHQLQAGTSQELAGFKKFVLPRLFKYVPIWLLTGLLAGVAVVAPLLTGFGLDSIAPSTLRISLLVLVVILVALYLCGKGRAAPAAAGIASNLAKARRLHQACLEKADFRHQQEQQRIQEEFDHTTQSLDVQWKQTLKEAMDQRGLRPQQIDEKASRAARNNELLHRSELERIERVHMETVEQLERQNETNTRRLTDAHKEQMARLAAEQQTRWHTLATEWKNCVQQFLGAVQAANAAAEQLFPEWRVEKWENWAPPEAFKNTAKFARLEVDIQKLAERVPKDPRLSLPSPSVFSVPLLLTYPSQGSILFETTKSASQEAVIAINNIIFRLLSTTPPGKLSFTIFDPVGLGENFAGLMHLADYEESHINSRIWTQATQIEEKLAELNEHMEKVIQMYLRNEYSTIAEYNAEAGTIAERYHFLVIASFPVNFSDTAARRLRNIAASGARCGVYTLIHWDQRQALPPDFVPEDLRKNSVCVVCTEKGFDLAGRRMAGTRLVLDGPPSAEFATHFLHAVGRSGKDSNRVEVPFAEVAPPQSKLWSDDTTDELRVPIGRSGATKLQYLAIGKGTRQHALIAGKTGSGKSTLFHLIITNLALWCSPEQVEFYLVDFKKGVEFKCYANRRLPHARVVAIESDRQFGLSVLQRVDAELRRRGDLFRKLGVQDLPGYKRAGGTESVPRSLLIIDEFQEFFVEEDRVSQDAAVLLDRIVRQGRAFGIHVLLGSQTLGGAYTLARATIGQMVIRIALQCNEADAYLIMDQDNPAPRLLSRPGEGIYNDDAGSIGGNSPFQAVWLPEDVRDTYLATIRALADRSSIQYPEPFVFEGNAPADVRENSLLAQALEAGSDQRPVLARIWLGAPNSIKGPTEAVFRRQSSNNLLIVGQSEEAALTILSIALLTLAAQYPAGSARFIVFDNTPAGSPPRQFLDRVLQAVPHELIQARNSNLLEIMGHLADDLKSHSRDERARETPETFVLIQGLQDFKKLRLEDDFSFSASHETESANPAALLLNLISEGPSHGFHLIVTCDTYNNVTRFLGRKTLSEFEMRVLFQMSASDSASLIDAPDAGTLGLHRALFYNDREGYLETFRPYARPGNDWVEEVTRQLKRPLVGTSSSSSTE